jgi:hypothetical protein
LREMAAAKSERVGAVVRRFASPAGLAAPAPLLSALTSLAAPATLRPASATPGPHGPQGSLNRGRELRGRAGWQTARTYPYSTGRPSRSAG